MSTSYGVALVLSLIAISGVLLWGTQQFTAAQRAQTAADLSAIAGATAHVRGDAPGCEVAQSFAQANHAKLVACETLGPNQEPTTGDIRVAVQVGNRTAIAVAGPSY